MGYSGVRGRSSKVNRRTLLPDKNRVGSIDVVAYKDPLGTSAPRIKV